MYVCKLQIRYQEKSFFNNCFVFKLLCLQAPQTGFQEKTVCCGLCVAGNISMSIKTDRKGYCPGKTILFFDMVHSHYISAPLRKKRSICISDFMQTTFFYVERVPEEISR